MVNNELELIEQLLKCKENNDFKEGLNLIEKYENLISKKYYEITKLKIEFLISLDKLIDASLIIKEELKVPYIPKDFHEFLNEKNSLINVLFSDKTQKHITFEDIENIDKVDSNTLLQFIPSLKEFNLNLITKQLQNIFDNNQISSLTKSLLIACLSDYKLNHQFSIVKEDTLIKFNPLTVFDIREGDNFKFIGNELKKFVDLEVNLLEIIGRLTMTYLLDLYPLVISESYCEDILTASLYLVSQMTGNDILDDKYELIYQTNTEKIDKIAEKMNILIESI